MTRDRRPACLPRHRPRRRDRRRRADRPRRRGVAAPRLGRPAGGRRSRRRHPPAPAPRRRRPIRASPADSASTRDDAALLPDGHGPLDPAAASRGRRRVGAGARAARGGRRPKRLAHDRGERRDDRPARDDAAPARRRRPTGSSPAPATRRGPTSADRSRSSPRSSRRPRATARAPGRAGRGDGRVDRRVRRPQRPRRRDAPGAGRATRVPTGRRCATLLTELALPADDARRALGPAVVTLASILDRRVELVEIGFDGGLRAVATPGGPSEGPSADVAIVPTARLAPADPGRRGGRSGPGLDDRRLGSPSAARPAPRAADRAVVGPHRRRRRAADGRGPGRRWAAWPTRRPSSPAPRRPDLVIAAGGVWSIAPGPAVALALADVLRRPGASGYAPRPRPPPRPARLDPGRRRAPRGDDRPRRRPAGAARQRRDAGRAPDRAEAPGRSRSTARRGRRPRRRADRPRPRRHRGRRPAARLERHRRVPVPGHRPARRPRPPLRGRRRRRARRPRRRPARRARCGCPNAPIDVASCSMRGRPRSRAGSASDRRAGPAISSLVPMRQLIDSPVDAVFALSPGDRALVEAGRVGRRRRPDRRAPAGPSPRGQGRHGAGRAPARRSLARAAGGSWRPATPGGPRGAPGGEYLFPWKSRWRVATGDIVDPLETPVAGIVREVRPGTSITIRAAGRGIRGVVALGGPTRGRLSLAAGPDGGLRPGALDVSMAGSILVVDARVDAETLTRARAMGVRGIVVAGLASKERRDFLASEARQRAALHRLPPYAVLVMDGATRRPMAGPIMALLAALVGREAAIVADPPMLIFDAPDLALPALAPDRVQDPRGGPHGPRGAAGSAPPACAGSARGVDLEAGHVRLADGSTVAAPARRPGAVRLNVAAVDPSFGYPRPMGSTSARHPPDRLDRAPTTRPRSAARSRASPGPATSSACGATSGPARRTSPRRSARGSA